MKSKRPVAMRTIALCLAMHVTLVLGTSGPAVAASGDGEADAAGRVNAFSISLFRQLAERDSGNIVVSPYSLECALAMAAYGAEGETKRQMLAVLNMQPADAVGEKDAQTRLGALARRLTVDAEVFSDASLLVHAKGIRMRDGYLAGIADIYRSSVRSMDFANARQAADDINAWVAKATRDRITKLVAERNFSTDTVAVLLNVLAFTGAWANSFSPEATRSGPFNSPHGKTTTAYMNQSLPVTVLELAEGGSVASGWGSRPVLARMAGLPFAGGDWEMLFFHPSVMPIFLAALTPENMRDWLWAYDAAAAPSGDRGNAVAVAIPKFAFAWGDPAGNIVPILKSMGMRDAFSPSADFSGMTRDGGFGISDVLHQARIEVDESGARAAAATAIVVTRSAAKAKEFILDSPFVFLVRHIPTGTILMLGRVDQPAIDDIAVNQG